MRKSQKKREKANKKIRKKDSLPKFKINKINCPIR